MEDPTAQQVLDRILAVLRTGAPSEQLAALHEMSGLHYSSQAVLQAIENILLANPEEQIAAAARAAMNTSANLLIRRKSSELVRRDRQIILEELEDWKADNLVNPMQAAVLESRYGFDRVPASNETTPLPTLDTTLAPETAVTPPPAPATVEPGPHPTLIQTLLSETSIKVYLYLGTFLMIAWAAIWAAVSEEARLPVLAGVTVLFGLASALTRPRLPQPSLVLFIVFSCLIPFDALVVADMVELPSRLSPLYWAGVYLVLALIWIFATWFFSSRFFSVAAFVAVDASAVYLLTYLDPEAEAGALLLALIGLVGLGCVLLLQRMRQKKFATPLFLATLLHSTLLLAFLLIVYLFRFFEPPGSDFHPGYWLVASLAWLLLAAYFLAADRLYPFPLFPFAAALVLLPLPATLLRFFDPPAGVFVAGYAVWAALNAGLSERLRGAESKSPRQLHAALLLAAFLAFLIAMMNTDESVWHAFATALWGVLLFGLLSLRKPLRGITWTAALLCGLAAFLLFFRLPFMEPLDISFEYLLTAAALLLFTPDWVLKADLGADRALRWPPRILALVLILPVLNSLTDGAFNSSLHRAVVWLLLALATLAYTLRYRKPWMPYVFTALLSFALLESIQRPGPEPWLPFLVGLAAAYYAAGSFLGAPLAPPLRYSGLALGSLAILWGLFGTDNRDPGWYSLLMMILYAVEVYRFKQGWVEAGIPIFASLALWMFLDQLEVHDLGYALTGSSVLWIASCLLLDRTFPEPRPLRRVVNIAASGISVVAAMVLLFESARVAAIGYAILTAAFLLNALARRSPVLAYSAAAALPIAVLFLLQDLNQRRWLFPLIAIAILYYALGFVLRRRAPAAKPGPSWEQTLTTSGLALATLVAVSAPAEESGLQAAIPVALAAVLWTVEALERRSVWLGFPSNALYLMSYFMMLAALDVDEPQFYSVGGAALGLLMHYLLNRAGHRTAAFLTGMLSQLVLLSTTYIQMLSTERLSFFAVLFFQGLAVLAYGLVIRSKSLVFTPIAFVVLGVVTVVYSALKGISAAILIGCTGVLLLLVGILAVILRERFIRMSERFGGWQA